MYIIVTNVDTQEVTHFSSEDDITPPFKRALAMIDAADGALPGIGSYTNVFTSPAMPTRRYYVYSSAIDPYDLSAPNYEDRPEPTPAPGTGE